MTCPARRAPGLVWVGGEADGAEVVYRWSTLFPSTFPRARTWQVFAQWHHTGLTGSPPVELYVVGEEIRLRVGGSRGEVLWRTPLRRGAWHDFALRVRWSADPERGLVELFHDGGRALPPTRVATRYPGQGTCAAGWSGWAAEQGERDGECGTAPCPRLLSPPPLPGALLTVAARPAPASAASPTCARRRPPPRTW